MKLIYTAVKDYFRDCWHDWLMRRVAAMGGKVYDKVCFEDEIPMWIVGFYHKEGSIWHYIRQRKTSRAMKIKLALDPDTPYHKPVNKRIPNGKTKSVRGDKRNTRRTRQNRNQQR